VRVGSLIIWSCFPPPTPVNGIIELFLRKVIHPQAHDNYRVILKDDGVEIEVGSIGVSTKAGCGALIPSSRCVTWKQRAAARIEPTACGSSGQLGTASARTRPD
jgi:hypothetical protein